MSFSIEIIDTHWIGNLKTDDPEDTCLHGKVKVIIGDEVVDRGDHDWTISTCAYRMLQSLFEDHIQGQEEHILPCCGFFMYIDDETDKLEILGCMYGIDWSVIHTADNVNLITASGIETIISYDEYKRVVLDFADRIENIYKRCSPKTAPPGDETKAYQRFWENWSALLMRANGCLIHQI